MKRVTGIGGIFFHANDPAAPNSGSLQKGNERERSVMAGTSSSVQVLDVEDVRMADRMVLDHRDLLVAPSRVKPRRLERMGRQKDQAAAFLACMEFDCAEQPAA